jgi:hypothetical protein
MKIKLPFTEKVLIEFYKFLEASIEGINQSIPDPLIHPPRYYFNIPLKKYSDYKTIFNKKYRKQKFWQFIGYLRNKGYLKTKTFNNYTAIILTPKGIKKILHINLKIKNLKKRADKKWQMVIFDIPENRRKDRDNFRVSLKLLGYQQLQKSIWVSQLDVLQETKNLIKFYKLEPFVQLLLLEKIKF